MSNYTSLLYKLIGHRLKPLIHKSGKTLAVIADSLVLDKSVLSLIQTGNANKRKNPYLINKGYMDSLSNFLNMPRAYIAYGDDSDKEYFIKMIILSTLMNDSHIPFKEQSIEDFIAEEIMSLSVSEKKKRLYQIHNNRKGVQFFLNSENRELYKLMQPSFNGDLVKTSTLIFKQLLLHWNYSRFILTFMENASDHSGTSIDDILESFYLNKWTYGGTIITDNCNFRYLEFIEAFTFYWNNAYGKYKDFFEKHLFSCDKELKNYGLKKISNQRIQELLASEEFIELNERLLWTEEYSNPDGIYSSIYNKLHLVKTVLAEEYIKTNDTKKFDTFRDHFSKAYSELTNSLQSYYESSLWPDISNIPVEYYYDDKQTQYLDDDDSTSE